MANEPKDFPQFTPLDYNTMRCKVTDLISLFQYYSPTLMVNWNDIDVSVSVMTDIVDRVEKRRVYFHVYYDGCQLGEMNETALQCFWIMKMFPFYDKNTYLSSINVKYSVFLFFRMVQYVAHKRGCKANINAKIATDLCYAFRYRDISKESLMHIAESLIY